RGTGRRRRACRRGGGPRHRKWDSRRRGLQDLRPLLHHQVAGHRAGIGDRQEVHGSPWRQDHRAERRRWHRVPSVVARARGGVGVPLILIVEDEKILAESVAVYLERHGITALVAHTGEDGIRMAEESSPDVAVVDLRLPGIDGLEVLRRLRTVTPGTEVIMATAHASIASPVEAMKRGAFDYLNKPLDLDELKVVVDKALAHLRLTRELSYLKARREAGAHLSEIIGDSLPVQALKAQVE